MSEGMIKENEKYSYMTTQYIDLNIQNVTLFDIALPPKILDG